MDIIYLCRLWVRGFSHIFFKFNLMDECCRHVNIGIVEGLNKIGGKHGIGHQRPWWHHPF